MSSPWERWRKTGRTRAALRRAVRLARERGYCFLVVADRRDVERMARLAEGMILGARVTDGPTRKVYLPDTGQISIESIQSFPRLDLGTGTVQGAHPNCGVVIDHHAVESHLGWALQEWLRDACLLPGRNER